jgi:hypothetical protein
VTDSLTTISDADLIARAEAAKASLAAKDGPTKQMAEYYIAARKLDPAVIIERSRKIRAILNGEDDAKPVPKRARKTRAATTTKATINRHIDIALARGLPVKGILPDGTVLTASDRHELITTHPLDTDDLDRELADFEARHG